MHQTREEAAKQAVRYFLTNSERIDPAAMIRNFAVQEPAAFNAFIAEIVGTTPARLAGLLAKKDPEVFLRLAKHENRHFEASAQIVEWMKNKDKISAIKKIRETWGFGLKQAKDVADLLHEHLITMNFLLEGFTPAASLNTLDDEQANALNLLLEHV